MARERCWIGWPRRIKQFEWYTIKRIKSKVLQRIHFETTSAFTDAELCIRAARMGYSIAEVDIEHLAREFGEALDSNKFVGFKIMWATFVDSIRMWKRLRNSDTGTPGR